MKKAYIEDYRFSEDLDFTLLDEKISNEQIRDEFNKLFAFIKEEAIDFTVLDKPWTDEERKEFSAFTKLRKEQRKRRQTRTATVIRRKVTA